MHGNCEIRSVCNFLLVRLFHGIIYVKEQLKEETLAEFWFWPVETVVTNYGESS